VDTATQEPYPQSSAASADERSHRRITDARAAATLAALSRFEIAGLRRQAMFGDSKAALLVGMAYETGYGVPQNCVKAGAWVARAAQAGNVAAQHNLGLRYRDGDGVAADAELADKWLKLWAAHKYAAAQSAEVPGQP